MSGPKNDIMWSSCHQIAFQLKYDKEIASFQEQNIDDVNTVESKVPKLASLLWLASAPPAAVQYGGSGRKQGTAPRGGSSHRRCSRSPRARHAQAHSLPLHIAGKRRRRRQPKRFQTEAKHRGRTHPERWAWGRQADTVDPSFCCTADRSICSSLAFFTKSDIEASTAAFDSQSAEKSVLTSCSIRSSADRWQSREA